MKAIFINTKDRTITEIEGQFSDYKEINKVLESRYMTHALELKGRDCVFVDDEGLLDETQDNFFYYEKGHQPFAGHGIILGHDKKGNTADVKISLDEVKSKVKFMDRFDAYLWAMANQNM